MYDTVAQTVMMESDRPRVLRQASQACRKGGTVSIPGDYGGIVDKFSMGAAFNKALTFKMGQTHMHSCMEPRLRRVQEDKIDPSFIISHRMNLDDAPKGYDMFLHKYDDCTRVVLKL